MTWQPTNLYDEALAQAEARTEAARQVRREREAAEAAALTQAGVLQDGIVVFAAQLEALGRAQPHDVEVSQLRAALRRLIRRIDPDWGAEADHGPRIGGQL